MQSQAINELVEQFVKDLLAILQEAKEAQPAPVETFNAKTFFDEVRKPLFGGRLTASQVSGMEAKIKEFQKAKWPLSWAAYGLATSYHETARKMQPVKEGLSASERWRKKNLRYYPWYGRGDVQLTWEENYARADKELGLGGALLNDLDMALDPEISAEIMVRGMEKGWFSGDKNGRHTLARHLPNPTATKAQFKQARRIINLMDKADMIADQAIIFQSALEKAEY